MRPRPRTNVDVLAGRRPPLQRLLHVWGRCPGFSCAHEDVTLVAEDGTQIAATLLPGAAAGRWRDRVPGVVLAHGFAAHRRKPAYAYLAERLSSTASVLTVDLRGHGRSRGRCTFGEREALDVAAAAAWLRRRGHRVVVGIGASMGGIAVLRTAAQASAPLDAVCAISTPAEWGLDDSAAMRAIRRLATNALHRRVAGTLLRIRMTAGWTHQPPPLAIVAHIAPAPLLLVHGEDDHFFGPAQAEMLYGAAGEPRMLWREPAGFGHAEDGFTPVFCGRLAQALARVVADGVWPAQAGQRRSGPLRWSSASSS